jgi:hypothetical protein
MEISSHMFWHAINRHYKKKIVIMKTFKEKGLRILIDQF